MKSAAESYECIRAACAGEHGLSQRELETHVDSIVETVLLARAQLPLDLVLQARARRLAARTQPALEGASP